MAMKLVRVSDEKNREVEKDYLRQVMQNNGYILKNINKATERAENKQEMDNQITNSEMEEKEKRTIQRIILLPYIQGVTDRISRIAKKN